MTKFILLFSVLLAESKLRVYGQAIGDIQADRPDQTETPFTVPKNRFQMESGFTFEKTDNATRSYAHPSALFKYGISDHFELGLVMEFITTRASETVSGLSPVTIRFKEKISDEKGILPTTSFIGYLTFPGFATPALKVKYFAPAFRFTMQHTLSDRFSLGYNAGAEWDGESAEPTFIYTFVTGYSISAKAGAYAELYGFAPQGSKADHRFDCGFTYLVKPNILMDISGGAGITKNAPDHYVGLGFSFRLKD